MVDVKFLFLQKKTTVINVFPVDTILEQSHGGTYPQKYYTTFNKKNNREPGHKVSTQKLRKDIQELKKKHKKEKPRKTTFGSDKNLTYKRGKYYTRSFKLIFDIGTNPTRVQATLMKKGNDSKVQKRMMQTLNSNKSIHESESEISVKGETSFTTAYYKRATELSKRYKNVNVSIQNL